ncbi:hypothetical protein [Blastococcus sp. URHD0036]|uniref:hypothetical protein n=1 Tax=Blastococcus sp. URHD0036 TaxID=1380356 RepID=UPI0006895A6D|nr:hypothetical protein [Blastococcus sp. URHD0036]
MVRRHVVELTEPHPEHVLTVGNGDFAYTTDITGMQTFPAFHDQAAAAARGSTAVNTATMSTWGWHEMPNPDGFVLEDAMSEYPTTRGPVFYPDRYDIGEAMSGQVSERNRAGAWLHANPQRIDLGRIGLALRPGSDAPAETDPACLADVRQRLDPWTGVIDSSSRYGGEAVSVRTVAAPDSSTVAFCIESPLLQDGRAVVALRFPYASDGFFQTADWTAPERHTSALVGDEPGHAVVQRTLDATSYKVDVRSSSGSLRPGTEPHTFELHGPDETLELVVRFAPADADEGPAESFGSVRARAAGWWESFWLSGAAVDLAGSTDPRAHELERRLVLSQYLTAVNCAGGMPPQETGLVTNSWQGKSHLEMHFWHAAHFAAWGRPQLFERSLGWYRSIAGQARATASRQGYPGLRWPKHVGPDGRESPDPTGSLLIWQQPHLLYLLELVWAASEADRRPTLVAEFADLVEETAEFMAAFAEERDGVFHLGPPVMPAQEFYEAAETEDPTYELAYWWWGLELAQRWRERSGIGRHSEWDRVQATMARPSVVDGRYAVVAGTSEVRRDDHPSMLAALGVLPPTPLVDPDTMAATLVDVMADWHWPSAWGWDFPVMAMTATRVGRPDLAVEALLKEVPRNGFTAVGHNPQLGSFLPIYLPGNGALLAAVSLMVTGSGEGAAPGFPADTWSVRSEGFVPWPGVGTA